MKETIVVATSDEELVFKLSTYFANDLLYTLKFVPKAKLVDYVDGHNQKYILLDGMYDILEKLNECVDRSKTSVMLIADANNMVNNMLTVGVDCIIKKPVEMDIFREQLFVLKEAQRNRENLLNKRLTNILLILGIPANVKGYFQLREAIKLVIHKPEYASKVTTDLYPKLAEDFNTTPTKVERTIRHSIEVAFNKGTISNIDKVLEIDAFPNNWKPTNSELIALLADRMILEGYSC